MNLGQRPSSTSAPVLPHSVCSFLSLSQESTSLSLTESYLPSDTAALVALNPALDFVP